jgi:hypothetical protein
VDTGQRFHFVAGWFSWIGDALHLVFAFGAMAWTIGIVGAPQAFSLPIQLFMIPLMVFFVCKALMGPLLYLRRVKCSVPDILGSALAGMALSHGIAQGVFAGLWHKTAVFEITEKGAPEGLQPGGTTSASAAEVTGVGSTQAEITQAEVSRVEATQAEGTKVATKATGQPSTPPWAGVREEALLLLGLLSCVAAMAWTRLPNHVESAMWMTILVLQAVPYAAALVCAGLSALPEFRPRSRPLPAMQPAMTSVASAAAAGPHLLATARAMSVVNEGSGTRTPESA